MLKGSKLTKLKSMIKRWQSGSKVGRTPSTVEANGGMWRLSDDGGEDGLQVVYVGKSRRRYLVSSQLLDHPLFRVLADKSSASATAENGEIVVGCEVVLFEHLLWMIENADPQLESLDDLVEFYAC